MKIRKKSHSTLRAKRATFTFFIKNAKMVHFGEFLKPETCGQTVLPDRSILIGQKLVENAKIKKFKCDILSDFQTLCKPFKRNPSFAFLCKDKQFFFSKNVKPAFFVKFFSLLNHPSFLWWRDGGAHFQVKRILILDFVQNRDYSKKNQ